MLKATITNNYATAWRSLRKFWKLAYAPTLRPNGLREGLTFVAVERNPIRRLLTKPAHSLQMRTGDGEGKKLDDRQDETARDILDDLIDD